MPKIPCLCPLYGCDLPLPALAVVKSDRHVVLQLHDWLLLQLTSSVSSTRICEPICCPPTSSCRRTHESLNAVCLPGRVNRLDGKDPPWLSMLQFRPWKSTGSTPFLDSGFSCLPMPLSRLLDWTLHDEIFAFSRFPYFFSLLLPRLPRMPSIFACCGVLRPLVAPGLSVCRRLQTPPLAFVIETPNCRGASCSITGWRTRGRAVTNNGLGHYGGKPCIGRDDPLNGSSREEGAIVFYAHHVF